MLRSGKTKFFYGYVILAIAWLTYFCNIGVIVYGIPAITAPMAAESGIRTSIVGYALAICTAMQGVCGPVVERIIMHRGVRIPAIAGNALLAFAFAMLAVLPAGGVSADSVLWPFCGDWDGAGRESGRPKLD